MCEVSAGQDVHVQHRHHGGAGLCGNHKQGLVSSVRVQGVGFQLVSVGLQCQGVGFQGFGVSAVRSQGAANAGCVCGWGGRGGGGGQESGGVRVERCHSPLNRPALDKTLSLTGWSQATAWSLYNLLAILVISAQGSQGHWLG